MIFVPELALKVMAGEKDVTRRLCSDNPRSPWWSGRCKLIPGKDYAVCPGRGVHAIGRVRVVSVVKMPLGVVSEAEARREGFPSARAFEDAWTAINGRWEPGVMVYRIEMARL